MNASGNLMEYVNRMKPVLKKLIPAPALRMAKQSVLKKITAQIEQVQTEPYDPAAYPYGVNLIGPLDSATGLGQSFRLLERVVGQCGVPYLIYNYAQNTRNKIRIADYESRVADSLRYSVNIWHVNPSDFAEMYACMGKESFDRRYNIAYWLWELEEFPDEWVPYIRLLDEIWTPSEFISESIRRKTDKPVRTVPYCVTAQADTKRYDRQYFGLPEDKFLFLMMYDTQSIQERKNPEGILQAYRQAFSPSDTNVGLVIKVNSASDQDLELLRNKMKGYPNLYFIRRNLERIEVNSLIADADVFVSLHRAEGFGLVLAEAMLNHVPTVATDWSANTEFMNRDVACMVSCRMKTLERDYFPYRRGNRWAEPDISEAADYMKRLANDQEYYHQIETAAYTHIRSKLGMDGVRPIVEKRLQEIKDGK